MCLTFASKERNIHAGERVFSNFSCSEHNSLSRWDIKHDAYGDIFITSPYTPSLWVGAEIKLSAVLDPWPLIPADDESFKF